MNKYYWLALLVAFKVVSVHAAQPLVVMDEQTPQTLQSVSLLSNSVGVTNLINQLKKRAEEGDGPSQMSLAKMYQQGIDVEVDANKAFYWYMEASKQYYDQAELAVAHSFENGVGVKKDIQQAIEWYQRLVAKNNKEALYRLAYIFTNYYPNNEEKAIAGLEYAVQAAQFDYHSAYYLLAQIYHVGYIKLRNIEQAFTWYLKAAESGNVNAQYNVASFYFYGKGVDKNLKQSAQWFERAAQGGHVLAQYSLGLRYLSAQGVDKNEAKAAHWFLKAAEQGNAFAQYSLALRYAWGQGVEENLIQENKWLEKAAEQDHHEAQYKLAVNYLAADQSDKALPWLEKAAQGGYLLAQDKLQQLKQAQNATTQTLSNIARVDSAEASDMVNQLMRLAAQGDAQAQNNLGVLYGKGEHVEKNNQKALFWLEQSADQGFSDALNNLAVIYIVNEMVATDYQKAHYFAQKSADKNNEKGKLLLIFLKQKLSESQQKP